MTPPHHLIMTIQKPLLKNIESIVEEMLSVIEMMEEISPGDANALADYKKNCLKIPDQIQSGLIKIAVVGVIKSGKSTFINSLIGKELVKRGAGVVTSITTRIRKGKKNEAVLGLKSWDEINNDLKKTLDMFPDDGPGTFKVDTFKVDTFDIRRKNDRTYLGQVYKALVTDFPVVAEGIRPETHLIRNALEGYNSCKDLVGADEAQIKFSSKAFEKHKAFTSDPARAFYVKDVCLEVFGRALDPNIEIADCQGADSIDPAQLAQIVKYMESANLIIYCISSRTGLRQSDMGFLRVIKRLGLLENILFVNNCDLTEHESLADLKNIESKISQELGFLTPGPRLYSFSALYDLFKAVGPSLSPMNAKRFQLWQTDDKMVEYCNDNSSSFHQMLGQMLGKKYYDLLLSNPMERIRMMAGELNKKADIFYNFLSSDLAGENRARLQLKEIQENSSRLRSIVDNSIQGAVSGLTKEIELNLKKAFARDSLNIRKKTEKFIKQTPMEIEPYRSQVKDLGFKQILYLVFQDFKRKLELFALEQINPEVRTLVEIQENSIAGYFQSLWDSYQIDFLTLSDHMGLEAELLSDPGIKNDSDIKSPVIKSPNIKKDPNIKKSPNIKKDIGSRAVDIQGIKKILGLALPETIFIARYTTRMRANALSGLGIQSLIQLFSSLMGKPARFSFTPGFKRAAGKIKKESLVSIQHQINDYHSKLNTMYFMPLIQAVTRDFKEKIHQRFSLYESLNEDMENLFSLKQSEKHIQQEKIQEIKGKIHYILRTANFIT